MPLRNINNMGPINMNGYSFDQRMKTNAMTKQLNEEIDWVRIKGEQLKDAAFEYKKVASDLMAFELCENLSIFFRNEHRKTLGLKNDEQGIDYSENVERLK